MKLFFGMLRPKFISPTSCTPHKWSLILSCCHHLGFSIDYRQLVPSIPSQSYQQPLWQLVINPLLHDGFILLMLPLRTFIYKKSPYRALKTFHKTYISSALIVYYNKHSLSLLTEMCKTLRQNNIDTSPHRGLEGQSTKVKPCVRPNSVFSHSVYHKIIMAPPKMALKDLQHHTQKRFLQGQMAIACVYKTVPQLHFFLPKPFFFASILEADINYSCQSLDIFNPSACFFEPVDVFFVHLWPVKTMPVSLASYFSAQPPIIYSI